MGNKERDAMWSGVPCLFVLSEMTCLYFTAIASISMLAPFGSAATAKAERAG